VTVSGRSDRGGGAPSLTIDEALAEANATFDHSVVLLRWPQDEDRRRVAAKDGVPRLLLLDDTTPPPRTADLLEDWLRAPVDREELWARRAELVRRAHCAAYGPALDDDGLLRWHDQWVPIPTAQVPVVALLVTRVREVVHLDEITAVYSAAGGSADRTAVKAVMGRIVKRCAQVGLAVRSVRGRGYVLDAPNECPVHGGAANTKDSGR
jgi:hypothetical protein